MRVMSFILILAAVACGQDGEETSEGVSQQAATPSNSISTERWEAEGAKMIAQNLGDSTVTPCDRIAAKCLSPIFEGDRIAGVTRRPEGTIRQKACDSAFLRPVVPDHVWEFPTKSRRVRAEGDELQYRVVQSVCRTYLGTVAMYEDELTNAASPSTSEPVATKAASPSTSEPNATHESTTLTKTEVNLTGTIGATAASSSILQPELTGDRYGPSKLVDGDISTAWGATRGKVRGEWIEVRLSNKATLTKARIKTGHCGRSRGKSLFHANRRIKSGGVTLDGMTQGIREFRDSPEWQEVVFEQPTEASVFRLLIQDAYEGSRWEDLHVAEVELWGYQI